MQFPFLNCLVTKVLIFTSLSFLYFLNNHFEGICIVLATVITGLEKAIYRSKDLKRVKNRKALL